MMKLILLAVPALALAAFASQSVSAATVTCEMPISQGSGGIITQPITGHRRFDLCGADGFAGTANVLRFEISPPPGVDDSQLHLNVKKTSGAGGAHLYILNGHFGSLVETSNCEVHDPVADASSVDGAFPCTTDVDVGNIRMKLDIDH
jgi:hypothetical protein